MKSLKSHNRREHKRTSVLKAVKYSIHSSSGNSSFYGYGIISDISESGIHQRCEVLF
jgi:hypothetical protein